MNNEQYQNDKLFGDHNRNVWFHFAKSCRCTGF